MTDQIHKLTLPRADDLHVHLRQGAMMQLVVPLLRQGGIGRCLVMPNTKPPVDSVDAALRYRDELVAIEPAVDYLMTLYLTAALTPGDIKRAAAEGITGVKLYPRGVTTNSADGADDVGALDPVFGAMETADLVLEIHGEVPSLVGTDICVLNAEARFMPELKRIHHQFPGLRIVLEHVTSAAGVDAVIAAGDTVAATITAHHLDLMVDDWAGRNHNFCKPVAKTPLDREALRRVVCEGNPKFFLGSDSAPHPRDAKECAEACAGVFTSPFLMAYLADTFERLDALDRLADFSSTFGRTF
ncbi:MAG: dihydroorotase, partial [Verrucomicrobia bacterium]|nr:dihydroorotase [Verrucomicrobiota bacterium]